MTPPDSLDPEGFEALFAHGARMRSLALALCAEGSDGSLAEDALQDAWVAAVQRPPAHLGSPGAWFARVLSNRANDRRRSESARRAREAAVARPEASHPSPEELVARVEVQRKLVEHVLELPEEYRVVIVERWLEERAPREIAKRLGVPASTVRTRLARGLEQLRVRLERAEGASWVSALAPLTGLTAPGGTPAGAPTGSALERSRALAPRSLLASAPATLLATVLALVAVWAVVRSSVGDPDAAEQTELGGVAALPESGRGAEAPPLELALREAVAVEERAVEPQVAVDGASLVGANHEPSEEECAGLEVPVGAGELAGLVLRGPQPVRGGSVWLRRGMRHVPRDPREPWGSSSGPASQPESAEPLHAPIGPDGRFAFREVAPDWYTLAVDLGLGTVSQVSMNHARGGQARSVVVVIGSAQIRGHVFDDEGLPVAGARVLASRGVSRNGEQRAFARSTWTSADGAYTLADLSAGSYRVGLHREGVVPEAGDDQTAVCRLSIGQQAVVDFGRSSALPVWTGALRTPFGEPVRAGRRLFLADLEAGRQFQIMAEGGSGLFRVALPAGRYTASVRGSTQRIEVGVVDVLETGVQADLVLPGAVLRGLAVQASQLEPWDSERPGFSAQRLSLRNTDRASSGSLSCGIDASGRFGFEGLEPGRWVLEGSPHPLVEGDGQLEFTVREGQRELSLTVTIDPTGAH